MSRYLLDTNVISELRKGRRCNPAVMAWMRGTEPDELFLSAITIGEIRYGVEKLKTKDSYTALRLENWLVGLCRDYEDRVLDITGATAELWGKLRQIRTLPAADGLIAASAMEHGCTVVTRNVRDFEGLGVPLFDPFS